MRARPAFTLFILPFVCLVAGCATYGNKLEPDAVRQIQRGVTTRAEVEAKLGVPSNVNLLPDGRRQAMYIHADAHNDWLAYTPYINYVAGGQVSRKQILQIIYKNDIVDDYEYTDTSEHTTGGMLNPHGTEVPTPGANVREK